MQAMDFDKSEPLEIIDLCAPTLDFDKSEPLEIIDLCAPTLDFNDQAIGSLVPQQTSTPKMTNERFPNLVLCIINMIMVIHYWRISRVTNQLNHVELARGESNLFRSAFQTTYHNATIPSFLREKYQMFFDDLLERLKVNVTILDYNYTRSNRFMKLLMYEQVQVFNLRPDDMLRIEEKECPLALEFFLQFDLNMFYMKTCSFRFARPRTLNEGLFCLQEPEARYELSACGNCGLCYPQYDMKYRTKKSIIEFSQSHRHTFINGYQTILNCSAVDYIGVTASNLHDRLTKHREHGNRIMHEFLIGQENILRDLPRGKSAEISAKDHMKLYQHSARCPVAMQIFLYANPHYWQFVPMLSEELDWNLRSIEDCRIYVDAIPKPLIGYTFSNRQIALQMYYMHKKRDKVLPNYDIDLYNATIVAVIFLTIASLTSSSNNLCWVKNNLKRVPPIGKRLNQNGHTLNEHRSANQRHDYKIDSRMPSSNQRSSSTRPSRNTEHTLHIHTNRSASVSYRQFVIILTNNPELLRQTRAFQPQIAQQQQATSSNQNRTSSTNNNNNNNNNSNSSDNNREQLLNNLLRLELRDVTQDYICRTRRSYPVHYVFDMSDIESQQQ
ncbi:unnamed protein product [Rotaria magnacalcarata]|uniref:Uncharacterized protein n=1 Tax=Rotaria magnacalcarata TaxID=392030 RepID=A0A816Z3V2_9BILA|nr:unnamed protein product [Rotaria magnacalcarata]